VRGHHITYLGCSEFAVIYLLVRLGKRKKKVILEEFYDTYVLNWFPFIKPSKMISLADIEWATNW
jgi:hypothetical protein